MRILKIAYGNRRDSKKWINKTVSFDELCERLKTPIRTTETVEEYGKMPKSSRDEAKDVGGFVPAELRNGRRKRENVNCVSMLKLDGDDVAPDFLRRFETKNPFAAVVYSTHSHTPEAPRLRILIPLTRDLSPDEGMAVTRYIANSLGIDQFDECSYQMHQLMYWPSCPSNGAYIFKRFDGKWLDPDDVLTEHPNWRDCSLLPTSSRESAVIKREIKHQQDPLAKEGIIGAFNNAHFPIQEFIESELSDVYEPAENGRYGFIAADSTAGVVIYDDRFAYSNHASDPAYGQLLNAFDLKRIHRYGHLEEAASVKAMLDDASKEDAVRAWLAVKRTEQANEDFAAQKQWQLTLELEKNGDVSDTYENYVIIAVNDEALQSVAYNELRDTLDVRAAVPWERMKPGWSKSDEVGLYGYLSHVYRLYSPAKADNAIKYAADKRRFHPIRDYLSALPDWDATPRVDTLLVRYLEADDTPYVRAVTRKTLVAAVARAYKSGTKFDSVLVLDGDQGIGKSTLFKELMGDEYYTETLTLTDMDDKTGAEKLQGFWAAEIPEFAGMKKADIEKVKAFMSTSDDKYRPSYGKTVESHPRQCILIGTVNGERGYLRDITGNRRFWVVKVHQKEQTKKWTLTDYERDQIWAEAKHLWQNGEKLYLEGELMRLAEEAQRDAMEVDERQGMVEEYLETLLPDNWDRMDTYSRRSYIADKDAPTTPIGTVRREVVSNAEIWVECFGRGLSELKPTDSYAIAAIMTRVSGWEKTKESKRIPLYGKQRFYKRTCSKV